MPVRPTTWKFDERKGIACCLRDHPFEHRLVESSGQDGFEKSQCISTAQRADVERWKATQVAADVPRRKDQCYRLCE